ncbi:hypothetical protein F2Q69_00059184 [Brassica cretica]|uniref:Uncharacterized protein n=1 Tax=Brassica cretica TaxID=69181 RepID=A0A8S9RJJ4_BRACR|nr:hypothetical protein F2Q69_00059184 [Brassica cretica]
MTGNDFSIGGVIEPYLAVHHAAFSAGSIEHVSKPATDKLKYGSRSTHTARLLRSDRTQAEARSLCSDRARIRLGRYIATKLKPKLGRYVATELKPKLGRYVATKLKAKLGRYGSVATKRENSPRTSIRHKFMHSRLLFNAISCVPWLNHSLFLITRSHQSNFTIKTAGKNRLDKRCDDIYFPWNNTISSLTSQTEAMQREIAEIQRYIASRPEVSTSIDRCINKLTDSYTETSIDEAMLGSKMVTTNPKAANTYPNRPWTSSSMAIGPGTSQARSLCSDRAHTRLGRYVATELGPKLGRYVATEHTHGSVATDRARAKAWSLRSDRARAKAWSLRSDRAHTRRPSSVATELEPKLGRYVATEHTHGDRALAKLGRYVATEHVRGSVVT